MKDARFIELVNLYIDRQIAPDEAAELELQIQTNPRRRQVYLEYCRMHRATKLVYESFRAHSEQTGQPARQPASIAHIQGRIRQRRLRWVYAASGLAAAACIAFVAAFRSDFTGSENSTVQTLAAAKTTPAAPAVATAAQTAPAAESARHLDLANPAFASHDYASLLASIREGEERLLSLQNATDPVRLNPLFDDGVFDERNGLRNRATNLQSRKNPRLQTEFTAFQFQR